MQQRHKRRRRWLGALLERMKPLPKATTYFLFLFFVCSPALAQTGSNALDDDNTRTTTTRFYKWEIGLDLLPLAEKSKDAFGFILKRNFKYTNGREALRIKFLPSLGYSGVGGNTTLLGINLAVGYEWQKTYGRFSTLYGVEPYVRFFSNEISGQSRGAHSNYNDLNIGASGFIGGRYYINRHISLSLESHLVYTYHYLNASNIGNASRIFTREHGLQFNPIHALYINYHF
jgi:hypothetical protein